MKEYLEDLIEQTGEEASSEEVLEAVKKAKEILESDLFIEQKGVRSLVDKDARVGYKSKTKSFYGYKAELCQTTDGSLITSITVEPGSYVDGSHFKAFLEGAVEAGLKVSGVYGDKAYFRADILNMIKAQKAQAYIPVSASAYKIDEELYSYNKDSDQWFCVMGNETVSVKTKTRKSKGKEIKLLEYRFERELCRNCQRRPECTGKSQRIAKMLQIGVNTPELYEYSQRAKTPEFLEEYRRRAKVEPKNAEMKRFHGLNRAKGYGLKSVRIQAKLTALVVKRIARMVSASNGLYALVFKLLYCKLLINQHYLIREQAEAV
jgi:hypothetical protein